MKRKKEGEEWYGKISYQDHEEELDDPTDVEKKIREGAVNISIKSQILMEQAAELLKNYVFSTFVNITHHALSLQLRMKWLGSGWGSVMTSSVWRSPLLMFLT